MIKFEYLRLVDLLSKHVLHFGPKSKSKHFKSFLPLVKYTNRFILESSERDHSSDDFSRTEFLKNCVKFQAQFLLLWNNGPRDPGFLLSYRTRLLHFNYNLLVSISNRLMSSKPLSPSISNLFIILLDSLILQLDPFTKMLRQSSPELLLLVRKTLLELLNFSASSESTYFGNGVLVEKILSILPTFINDTSTKSIKLAVDISNLKKLFERHRKNNDFCRLFLYFLDSLCFHLGSSKDAYPASTRVEGLTFLVDLLHQFSQWSQIDPLRNSVSDCLNSISTQLPFIFSQNHEVFLKTFEIFLNLSQDENQMIRMNMHANLLWLVDRFWNFDEIFNLDIHNPSHLKNILDALSPLPLGGDSSEKQSLPEMVLSKDSSLTVNSVIGLEWVCLFFLHFTSSHPASNEYLKTNTISKLGALIVTKYLLVNKKSFFDKEIDFFFLPDKLNKFEELVIEQSLLSKVVKAIIVDLRGRLGVEDFYYKISYIRDTLRDDHFEMLPKLFGMNPIEVHRLELHLGYPVEGESVSSEKEGLVEQSRLFWGMLNQQIN